jgi:hypothetical protein
VQASSTGKTGGDVNDKESARLFQSWLAHMSFALAEFTESLPKEVRERLDSTPASLDVLEAWLLSRYAHANDAKAASESKLLDGAARYFGEIFRQASHSKWDIQSGDPKVIFFGMPVLIGGKLGSLPVCPLTTVTASLHRRTGTYMAGIVKNFSD